MNEWLCTRFLCLDFRWFGLFTNDIAFFEKLTSFADIVSWIDVDGVEFVSKGFFGKLTYQLLGNVLTWFKYDVVFPKQFAFIVFCCNAYIAEILMIDVFFGCRKRGLYIYSNGCFSRFESYFKVVCKIYSGIGFRSIPHILAVAVFKTYGF